MLLKRISDCDTVDVYMHYNSRYTIHARSSRYRVFSIGLDNYMYGTMKHNPVMSKFCAFPVFYLKFVQFPADFTCG